MRQTCPACGTEWSLTEAACDPPPPIGWARLDTARPAGQATVAEEPAAVAGSRPSGGRGAGPGPAVVVPDPVVVVPDPVVVVPDPVTVAGVPVPATGPVARPVVDDPIAWLLES
jgi:hypothetical protein